MIHIIDFAVRVISMWKRYVFVGLLNYSDMEIQDSTKATS